MPFRRIFVFVEGPDDVRFFDAIVRPRLSRVYDWVDVLPYATWKPTKIDNFIRSITSMGAEYLLAGDADGALCVSEKKTALQGSFKRIDPNRIVVVVREIECWYQAGLNDVTAKKLGIHCEVNTDATTKERFNTMMPKRFSSRVDWMLEMLRLFSIPMAKEKNRSFRYFSEKYGIDDN